MSHCAFAFKKMRKKKKKNAKHDDVFAYKKAFNLHSWQSLEAHYSLLLLNGPRKTFTFLGK